MDVTTVRQLASGLACGVAGGFFVQAFVQAGQGLYVEAIFLAWGGVASLVVAWGVS